MTDNSRTHILVSWIISILITAILIWIGHFVLNHH